LSVLKFAYVLVTVSKSVYCYVLLVLFGALLLLAVYPVTQKETRTLYFCQ